MNKKINTWEQLGTTPKEANQKDPELAKIWNYMRKHKLNSINEAENHKWNKKKKGNING